MATLLSINIQRRMFTICVHHGVQDLCQRNWPLFWLKAESKNSE